MLELDEGRHLLDQIREGEATTNWSSTNGLAMCVSRVFVPLPSSYDRLSWPQLMGWAAKAYRRHHLLRASYNAKAAKIVKYYIKSCEICQRNKLEHLHPVGLLQPLEIPSSV